MTEGVETGLLRPSEYPYERAAGLTAGALGALGGLITDAASASLREAFVHADTSAAGQQEPGS